MKHDAITQHAKAVAKATKDADARAGILITFHAGGNFLAASFGCNKRTARDATKLMNDLAGKLKAGFIIVPGSLTRGREKDNGEPDHAEPTD